MLHAELPAARGAREDGAGGVGVVDLAGLAGGGEAPAEVGEGAEVGAGGEGVEAEGGERC